MGIINNIMFAAPYSPAFAGVPFNAAYGAAPYGYEYAAAATPFYGGAYGGVYGDNLAAFGAYGAAPYAAPAWGGVVDAPAAYGGPYGLNTYPAWGNVLAAGGYPYAFDGAYNGLGAYGAWSGVGTVGTAYDQAMIGATTFNDGTLLDISTVANPVNALNGFASPIAPAVPYGYGAAYGAVNAWY